VDSVSTPRRLDGSTWRIDAVVPGSPLGERLNAVKGIRDLSPPFTVDAGGTRGLRRWPRRDRRRPDRPGHPGTTSSCCG
jgi:hypothetical protein